MKGKREMIEKERESNYREREREKEKKTNLTHVASSITWLDIFDDKCELSFFRMYQMNPIVPCYDVIMNGKNTLIFHS